MASKNEPNLVQYAVQALESELGSPSQQSRTSTLAKLEALQGSLVGASAITESVERMFLSTVELVRLGITLEAEIERLRIETNYKRERIRVLAPGAIKALEGIGMRIQSLIDGAMAIDPSCCPESQLQWRNRLLELADKNTESLNNALMKLLS